ncbi:MAG: hypothetical protein HUK40_18940 [Desulfobacter sp.]|nr:hypothetical protein [Desulfobacter sp.]WDP86679.1 MAG: hypothetical protein HUN05_17395 [Desulfobacter sp.]
MSDFLRNLRSSHKKETPAQRKKMDPHFYPQPDRRIIQDRRLTQPLPQSKDNTDVNRQISDILPMILDNSTLIAEQVEKMATINEMMVESRIRQYNAVADFFEGLGQLIRETPRTGMHKPPKATTSYTSGTHYTKDDILSIINKMRDEGTTFAIIAEYLKEKGIPTFSGRGEWHAQTIHRLCK